MALSANDKIEQLKKQVDELQKEIDSANETNVSAKTKQPKKIFYRWSSPSRPFIKRDRAWFVKVSFVGIVLIFLMAIINDRTLIIAISAVLLVVFLLATVPPNPIEHAIASTGIQSLDTFYRWKDLKEFWVAEKYGSHILYIPTKLRFPGLLTILLDNKSEKKVIGKVSDYLDYKEQDPTKQGWLSKITEGTMISGEEYGLVEDETKESKTS